MDCGENIANPNAKCRQILPRGATLIVGDANAASSSGSGGSNVSSSLVVAVTSVAPSLSMRWRSATRSGFGADVELSAGGSAGTVCGERGGRDGRQRRSLCRQPRDAIRGPEHDSERHADVDDDAADEP